MEMPELKMKHAAVGVAAVLIVVAFVGLNNMIATINNSGSMSLDGINCQVTLGVTGLMNGIPVNCPILNSPLYLNGVEVTNVKFTITIVASGQYVKWDTLMIHFYITSEGYQASGRIDWTVADFALQADGTYKASANYTVDEYIDTIGSTAPDEILDDGTKIWNLDVAADVGGTVIDTNDNELSDDVTVTTLFKLASNPDGSFNLSTP